MGENTCTLNCTFDKDLNAYCQSPHRAQQQTIQ